MIIDANMYWLPEKLFTDTSKKQAFLRAVPSVYDTRIVEEQLQSTGETRMAVERPIGYASLNYASSDYRLEQQLTDMATVGIDQGILKLPGCQEWLTLELCRFFNDEAYQHVQASNGKLHALAVVPPLADEEVYDELERAVVELGFTGLQLSAHYGGSYLDDPRFRPFLKKVNELKLPIYVHHTPVPVDYQSIYTYDNLRRTLGRCMDQLTAIGRELFSGMLEELPDTVFIHSMLGGGIHNYLQGLCPTGGGNGRFDNKGQYYRELFDHHIFLEMSNAQPWGMEQLVGAAALVGAEKVIYGSSYPVKQEWFTDGPAFINQLSVSDKEKAQILAGNAKRLYKLPALV